MQCQAHNKKTGAQCKRRAVTGMRVCMMHGGKTPVGIASPHFKTGRYSKHLPTRLLERYNEAVSDEELLALREDIALLDARVSELLGRVDNGESGRAWKMAQKALSDYLSSYQSSKETDISKSIGALSELQAAVGIGLTDTIACSEIQIALEQRRKLVESERERLVEMQQFISSERAMLLISAVVDVVRRNVTDRTTLSNITHELSLIINKPEPELAEKN